MSDSKSIVRPRYPGLDGLRALAMLAVFFHHYNLRPSNRYISAFVSQGYCGVQIFFVLSGFLITGILWDSRNRSHKMRDFYARRILRIFPLYYAFWILLFALTPLAHFDWNWRWSVYLVHLGNYVREIFYNPANLFWLDTLNASNRFAPHVYLGHLWSLCVEEQFYFVWPWLVYLCPTRERLRTLCIATVVAAPILRFLLVSFAPPHLILAELIYRATPTQMDSLALGGLLAVLIRGPEAELLRKWNGWISLGLATVSIVYWAECFLLRGFAFPGTNIPIFEFFGLPAMDLLGVALVLRASHAGSELESFFAWRPLAAFGTITYGFYIFHDPPHLLYSWISTHFTHGHNQPTVTCAVAFIGTLIISTVSFRFFETPLLRFKARFGHQTHKAIAT